MTPVLGWSISAAAESVSVAARLDTSCSKVLWCLFVPEIIWYPEFFNAVSELQLTHTIICRALLQHTQCGIEFVPPPLLAQVLLQFYCKVRSCFCASSCMHVELSCLHVGILDACESTCKRRMQSCMLCNTDAL